MLDDKARKSRLDIHIMPIDLSWITEEDKAEIFAPPKQPSKFLDDILAEIKKGQ